MQPEEAINVVTGSISAYTGQFRPRAREKTIQIINECLPSPGDVCPPKGETDQVRFVLRHKSLRARVRPRQHPRIAAAFKPAPQSSLIGKRSFLGHHPVREDHVQVLVPVLGKDIGLTKKDRNGDWVTYVTTVDEAIALGNKFAAAMVLSS